ncbi:DUF397 domain-containing protein [Streptomyces sp. NPDC020096]
MHTPRPELSDAIWRKSTYSSNQGGECVEVADGRLDGLVPVRDSKEPNGPALIFTAEAWTAFVTGLKAGDFPASA